VRALRTRVEKLERGKAGDGNAQPFYILWVPAGADRVAALEELRASGKIAADVPAYCAEWKPPRGRVLEPSPRSRLTDHQRISDDEEAVLSKAICDDLESSGFSFNSSASDDVRGQQRMCEMTDRELLGVILRSPIDMLVFTPHCMPTLDHEQTFASLFEGLIGPRSNLRSHFARANDLGKFGRIQWTTL
jgi:hypothetical protein